MSYDIGSFEAYRLAALQNVFILGLSDVLSGYHQSSNLFFSDCSARRCRMWICPTCSESQVLPDLPVLRLYFPTLLQIHVI